LDNRDTISCSAQLDRVNNSLLYPKDDNMSAFQELFSTFITVINIPPYSMIICLFSYSLLFYMAPSVSLRMALLLYLTYAILDPTPRSPIKPPLIEKIQPYCNRIWFFRLTAKYFSCKLHKTYDLSPGKSYIFAYHPHGVIGMGCSMGLATDASNFRQVFPGVRQSVCSIASTTS
jgi:hypothetical protein